MEIVANHDSVALNKTRSAAERHLSVRLANCASEVIAAQRLRYKVFCEENGADLHRHDVTMSIGLMLPVST